MTETQEQQTLPEGYRLHLLWVVESLGMIQG